MLEILKMDDLVRDFKPDTILHMALLSATCADPLLAWDINMNGLVNALGKDSQAEIFHPKLYRFFW